MSPRLEKFVHLAQIALSRRTRSRAHRGREWVPTMIVWVPSTPIPPGKAEPSTSHHHAAAQRDRRPPERRQRSNARHEPSQPGGPTRSNCASPRGAPRELAAQAAQKGSNFIQT
jgi:hypothetical protein